MASKKAPTVATGGGGPGGGPDLAQLKAKKGALEQKKRERERAREEGQRLREKEKELKEAEEQVHVPFLLDPWTLNTNL